MNNQIISDTLSQFKNVNDSIIFDSKNDEELVILNNSSDSK